MTTEYRRYGPIAGEAARAGDGHDIGTIVPVTGPFHPEETGATEKAQLRSRTNIPEAHMARVTELQRRRELSHLTKPELIDLVIAGEHVVAAVEPLIQSIDAAFGEEP